MRKVSAWLDIAKLVRFSPEAEFIFSSLAARSRLETASGKRCSRDRCALDDDKVVIICFAKGCSNIGQRIHDRLDLLVRPESLEFRRL